MLARRRAIILAYLLGCALWGGAVGFALAATVSRVHVDQATSVEIRKVRASSRLSELEWKKRFQLIRDQVHKGDADMIFLGDSITQGWAHVPEWGHRFGAYRALNAGIASDRVEHLLWRVRHGHFDKIKPKVAVVLIGVNNLAISTPDDIAAGVREIILEIQKRSPETRVLLLGLFPSGKSPNHPRRMKVMAVNQRLAEFDHIAGVDFLDIGHRFLERDGSLSREIMPDYLHLSRRGYAIWAEAIEPHLIRAISRSS